MDNYFAFIDESRNGRYTLCLLRVESKNVASLRQSMNSLRMKGQNRIHMKQESDSRRREILSALNAVTGWDALILQSNKANRISPDTRQKLLLLMAQHPLWQGVAQVTIEDSTESPRDKKTLTWLMNNGAHEFRYAFKKPSQDPGLWAADALVWAFAKGGSWRAMISNRIQHVVAPRSVRSPKMSPSGQVLGVLSRANAFDISRIRPKADNIQTLRLYFLVTPRTLITGSATFEITVCVFAAQGYLRPSKPKTIIKIGNQNFFKIQRIWGSYSAAAATRSLSAPKNRSSSIRQ